MVQRFHQQLKTSIKASPDSSKWPEILPLILLNIRSTVKQDQQCIPVQLVFGTTLYLPGHFFTPSSDATQLDPKLYADRLSSYMQQLRPIPPRLQSPSSHLASNLSTCTHIFFRHDALQKPLQPPYDGPYQIIHRAEKHYTLDINGKTTTITLDRLKPAYLDSDTISTIPPVSQDSLTDSFSSNTDAPEHSPRTTRSGQRVHFPDRYGT